MSWTKDLPRPRKATRPQCVKSTRFPGTPIARKPSGSRSNGLVKPANHQGNEMREVVLYVEDHPVNVLLMQTVSPS